MWNRKKNKIEELEQERYHRIHVTRMLMLLAEGCTKHPSYRAVRKPTATCPMCENLYEARQLLNINPYATDMGYVQRTGKRGKARLVCSPL